MDIKVKNSNKSVRIMENGMNAEYGYIAAAMQDGEYWFTVGHFKTLKGAIRSAEKQLARLGYSL